MAGWFRKPQLHERPVLDREYLDRLAGHIGLAEVRELTADGMLELCDRLDRLAEHAARGEIEAIATLCHDITGAAGHLGLSLMSATAAEANRVCHSGPPLPGPEIVAPVLDTRGPSIAAMADFCACDPAAITPQPGAGDGTG